jgi:predicted component of type VI protein secretion system
VVAAAAVAALHRLFDLQSQARRQLGVRAPTLQALRDASLLRRATSAAAGLQALQADGCDAAGQLQRSADELVAHQNNLLAAFHAAVERLGEELSPGSLMAMLGDVPAPDTATKARLWDLYTDVWRGLGLEAGRSWTAGFVETALARLAEAYDDRTRG